MVVGGGVGGGTKVKYKNTTEPRYNESLCNEVLGIISNDSFHPGNRNIIMEKNLDITKHFFQFLGFSLIEESELNLALN